MSNKQLIQTDLDKISAYLDGELNAEEAAQVADRIDSDSRWAGAADDFGRLDDLLGAWDTPKLRRDLTASIMSETRRKQPRPAWVQWAAPLAAAAAIVIGVGLFGRTPQKPADGMIVDQFVIENRKVLDDYDTLTDYILVDYETMVSVPEQLQFKRSLLQDGPSLSASLQASRRPWEQLDEAEQQALRQRAYAFRDADQNHQAQIREAWNQFERLSQQQQAQYRQRAPWLKTVINSLTTQQKQQLLEMKPIERARELLRIKQQMLDDGRLSPATAPAEK